MIVIEITLRNRASMEFSMLELQIVIALVCMIGCGFTSWKLGHRAGIEHALDFLEAQGVIEFTEGESSL